MPRLMIRHQPPLQVAHHRPRLLGARHDLLQRVVDVGLVDRGLVAPRRHDGRLVHDVLQVGAGEAGRPPRDHLQVHVGGQGLVPRVHLQDLGAPRHVRAVHCDLPVESAGAQQSGVQDVGAVGGREDDDAGVALEAVHFGQQLIDGLLPLVAAPAPGAAAALPPDGVELVDEDDARGLRLGALEQVPHPRRPHAHEHLHELRRGDGEERHTCLPRHGLGQQRLPGPGRPRQQAALGDLGPESRVLARALQEVHHLLQLQLGAVHPGHVPKAHVGLRHLLELGAGLGEVLHPRSPAGGPPPRAPPAAHDEAEEAGQRDEQHHVEHEVADVEAAAVLRTLVDGDVDAVALQHVHEVRVVGEDDDGAHAVDGGRS
mmetsp:Transcript_68968/g.110459  ORF Transcript_68968/g.110459 Transcript_68968/m.110459 type:complete len:372 (+) Transcript_68968:687-1802(+)